MSITRHSTTTTVVSPDTEFGADDSRRDHPHAFHFGLTGDERNRWRTGNPLRRTRLDPDRRTPNTPSFIRLDRDFQRSKVYRAEREAWTESGTPMWSDPMPMEDVADLVQHIVNDRTFILRWGRRPIRIKDGRGCRSAFGGGGVITLPRQARAKPIILHEIAHAICPVWERHGRLYARTYLTLVKMFADDSMLERDPSVGPSARLREAFDRHGVHYQPQGQPIEL